MKYPKKIDTIWGIYIVRKIKYSLELNYQSRNNIFQIHKLQQRMEFE